MSYITLERNKLYEEIWKEPMSVLCKRYSLSDNGLRKICIKLEIPIPDRSYWGKLRAGKTPEKRKLPKYDGNNEYQVYIDDWAIKRREQRKEDSLRGFNDEEKERILDICNNIKLRKSTNNLHPLIEETKQNIRDNNKSTFSPYYYRTYKTEYLNVQGSAEIKNRIYLIYHTIFTTIEKLGYSVEKENQGFYLYILGEKVKFSIKEKTKIVYRDKTEKDTGYYSVRADGKIRDTELTGILELKIDYYYAKRSIWKDTDKKKIEDMIGEIVQELLYCATKMREDRLEREEEHERYMERQQRIREFQKQKEDEMKKLSELEEMAKKLHRANIIRQFINEFESKSKNLTKEQKEYIKWAQDKADWLDPLINKKDDILDKEIKDEW